MKNTLKALLVAITAFSFSVANAGDLTITGSAKASYSITSSDNASAQIDRQKGLGVTNEFSLSASGELDNGMSWNYKQDIDGATVQDDGQLTLTTDYGTLGVFISEGGLDVDNAASQSVVSRPSDTSYNEGMVDSWDISGLNTLQYHTPADLLPFGISAKVAYAPSMVAGINDYKATGAGNTVSNTNPGIGNTFFNTATGTPLTQTIGSMGDDATHYQVKIAAIPYADGLTLGADYLEIGGQDAGASLDQKAESGSYYGTYAAGMFSIGYSKSFLATKMTEATSDFLESIETTKYSVAANINDNFSISYEKEESEPNSKTAATAMFDLESTGIQAAYTLGGMTLAVAMNDHQNAQYTENKDVKDTVFSVAMAF
jgi:hypothetical protein